MIGWLAVGLVAGFAGGFAVAWIVLRRPEAPAGVGAGPSLAPERSLAEPLAAESRTDEEIHQALDATKGLLDELEGRYRGRTAPPEDGGAAARRPARRPVRKPPEGE